AFVFVLSPFVMATVLVVGAATALLAATIALVQNDIKKVLAYSTVSQLGFMFIGVGVGAFTAGFFHVLTHAFFKACLFLGAGSVIHAMHARIHDDVRRRTCATWAACGNTCPGRSPRSPCPRSRSRARRFSPASPRRTRSPTAPS